MKRALLPLLFIFPFGCSSSKNGTGINENQLYQYGVIDGLLAGAFDGDLSIENLKKQGDFGIGTFNRADGELVAFGGDVYRVNYSGTVMKVDIDSTPFAAVVTFKPDTSFTINSVASYERLQSIITATLNSNSIYAIRLSGSFDSLTTRAIAAAQKPYPTLSELVATSQHLFHYENLNGDCIGFLIPDYMGRINIPGFHFHFLSADHLKGGHVFALSGRNISVAVQQLKTVVVQSNTNESFMHGKNRKDRSAELKKIE
jgi:acetolactate decarboxylase